jgi:GAF domain-containing protein
MVTQEIERLKAVKRFENFDFALHNGLQGLLEIAADIYETPAAFITLIDDDDQFFKVSHGFQVLRMPRETSFCTHTILLHEPMIVCDALKDNRFANSPLVRDAPNIRFYAGAALSDYDGQNIGTLCVMDNKPKQISEDKKQLLPILAKQAIHLMELEINYNSISSKLRQSIQQNTALKEIAFIQSYEFRQPLGKIKGLIHTIKENHYRDLEGPLQMIEDAVNKLDKKIEEVEQSTELVRNKFIGGGE